MKKYILFCVIIIVLSCTSLFVNHIAWKRLNNKPNIEVIPNLLTFTLLLNDDISFSMLRGFAPLFIPKRVPIQVFEDRILGTIGKSYRKYYLNKVYTKDVKSGYYILKDIDDEKKELVMDFIKHSEYRSNKWYFMVSIQIFSLIIVALFYIFIDNYLLYLPFAVIFGGALGNLLDRIIRGAVADYIFFHNDSFILPVFNIADIFTVIGALWLLFAFIFVDDEEYVETTETVV